MENFSSSDEKYFTRERSAVFSMQKARESTCRNLSAVILGQRLIGLQVARNFSPAATLSDSIFFLFFAL